MKFRISLPSANSAGRIGHSSLLAGAKLMLSTFGQRRGPKQSPPGGRPGSEASNDVCEVYRSGSAARRPAHVDVVVRDHAESDPALHSGSPLYRGRLRPFRRLATLMFPSHPVLHFWPSRNRRFFCSRCAQGFFFSIDWECNPLDPVLSQRPHSGQSRTRSQSPPPRRASPAGPGGLRRPGSTDRNHWGTEHRLRSRQRSGFRLLPA
ncbi:hypothetical protein ABIA96_007258 [Bradyrhizobium sp. LB11.1]